MENTNDEEMRGDCWDLLYCSVERVCHGMVLTLHGAERSERNTCDNE